MPSSKMGPKPIPLIKRFEDKILPIPECGCWIWEGSYTGNGYGVIWDGSGYDGAHRVSYALYNGAIPAGKQVLHHCDTPSCVNPKHLFIGTHADNMKDKIKKNRHAWGEKNGGARLSEQDVIEIKASDKSGDNLAKIYGVHRTSIHRIQSGRTWRQL